MSHWLKRIVVAVLVLEFAYLAIGNLALRLPLTQVLVNKVRPDKFEVSWDAAWTFYPFRVHVRGLAANGQSRRQQWQLELTAGSGSIALLPLLTKRVLLSDVRGEDVLYFQRPRLRPDNDYASTRAFFPPIGNRVLNAAEPRPSGKRPWRISVSNASVRGTHDVWLYQVRARLRGELRAGFRYRTRGGPFALGDGWADLTIDDVGINGDHAALGDIRVKGRVALAEFVPRETRGIRVLPHLTLDADVSGEVGSLAFLNPYLRQMEGMELAGRGRVAGRLNIDRGTLRAGTRLDVAAAALTLDLLAHRASGSGTVRLAVGPDNPDELRIVVEFSDLTARRRDDPRPLLVGAGLIVEARGETRLSPDDALASGASYLSVGVPTVRVPDVAVFQHYIPDHVGLRLHSGEGLLHGRVTVDTERLEIELGLAAGDTALGIEDFRFQSDIDLTLLAKTAAADPDAIDLAGSTLLLSDVRLARGDNAMSDAWLGRLAVDAGRVRLPGAEAVGREGVGLRGRDVPVRELLDDVEGEISLSGSVSHLGWLSQLIANTYGADIDGTADLGATLVLRDGWLAPGTEARLVSDDLVVGVLDYHAQGRGSVRLEVAEGGRRPDASIDVRLQDAVFKRRQEETAFIEAVDLRMRAVARDLSYSGPTEDVSLRLAIPFARVTDMRVYNRYLPQDSPLQILGGSAELTADIALEPADAGGWVTLNAPSLHTRLDTQELSGDLRLDVTLAGGRPQDMAFDISGSTLTLDDFRVSGDAASRQGADWHATVRLARADTVWRPPVQISADADLVMKDSSPIVAMLSNYRGKHGWIEQLLTVDQIAGEASLRMRHNQIVFPYAYADSDEIGIGAKGVIDGQTRDGVILARYRQLKGLLKIRDGKRSFDLIRPQKKFDAYTPTESAE
jgi:hypothetical protein